MPFAIETKNWVGKTPQIIGSDAASFSIEARRGEFSRRINVGVASLNIFRELVNDSQDPENRATKAIVNWAENNPPGAKVSVNSPEPTENEILRALPSQEKIESSSLLIWFSPILPDVYEESLIVIYQTIEVNGQKHILYRALCGTQTFEQCLKIAGGLIPYLQPDSLKLFKDPRELRAIPLQLSFPKNEKWIDILSRHIQMPEVWQAITSGQDIEEKLKALAVAQKIIGKYHPQIANARTEEDLQRIGRAIEWNLQRELGIILQPGPCGELYLDSLGSWGLGIPSFGGKFLLGGEWGKFIRNCGACGKELHRYMTKGDRCPYCNGIYEGC